MTAQLPTPGGDDGTWGGMLNEFLEVSHNDDGTLNSSAVSNALPSPIPATKLGGGTPSGTNFLRGDGIWAVPSGGGVSLDNTSPDIQPLGTQAAGGSGLAADAKHVHAMPRLDQVSNPTSSVSLNSQKISNLQNGTNAQDAATFGQIPTAGTGASNFTVGNATVGGDLSGTLPNPTVAKLDGISISGTPTSGEALVATSASAASWGAIGGVTDWINVKEAPYNAVGNGTSDDTTAIQNALNAVSAHGGTVYLPAGTYKISSALTVSSGTVLLGASESSACEINQSSATADAIDGSNISVFVMRGLRINGPSSGSGIGIHLSVTSGDTSYVDIADSRVTNFGSDGIKIDNPIVCQISRVVSNGHGSNGFNINGGVSSGAATSCHFEACYAISCAQAGYVLNDCLYSVMDACATDSCGAGYRLLSCTNVSMTACGCESTVNNGGTYIGQAFEINNSRGVTLTNPYNYANASIAFWVTNGSSRVAIMGPLENVPTGSASASAQVDSGCSAYIYQPSFTTATSYVGNVNQFNAPASSGVRQIDVVSSGNINAIRATSNTGGSGGNNQPIYLANGADSSTRAFGSWVATDSVIRFMSDVNGTFTWGTGAASRDTQLQRTAAGTLTLSNLASSGQAGLLVGGNLLVGATSALGDGGVGVIEVANVTTTPATPTGGGVLYAASGIPQWHASDGGAYSLAPINQLAPADMSYAAWVYDPIAASHTIAPSTGVVYGMLFEIRDTVSVSKVILGVASTTSMSLTSGENFVGIYNAAGTQMGVSADITSSVAVGEVAFSLTSSVSLTPDYYWAALLMNGSTLPTIACAEQTVSNLGAGQAGSSKRRFGTIASSATAMPASFTPSSMTALTNQTFWVAIS